MAGPTSIDGLVRGGTHLGGKGQKWWSEGEGGAKEEREKSCYVQNGRACLLILIRA